MHPLTGIITIIFQKLRKVILEDQLGICGELDAMMDNLINTYEDEWANVVKGLYVKKLVKNYKRTQNYRLQIL
jgi:nitrite reductase (NAD(P)H)